MTKPIILSEKNWLAIYNQIAKNYPPSVLLIRNRMREVLGFTSRKHEEWVDRDVDRRDVSYGTKYRITTIHLDFYNESKRTMFLLKYSDYIGKTDS
jgi:hypothetical protein